MKNRVNKLGFTLIELLVVITIIGILATGAVTVYTSQIQKARDSTRLTDVKSLQSGIEQFYQDETDYPEAGDFTSSGGIKLYTPNLAEDPKHDQTCNNSRCGYIYAVAEDTNGITKGAYELSTAFESAGNVKSKADNTRDNGDDAARFELGVPGQSAIITTQAQGTAFGGGAAADDAIMFTITRAGAIIK